MRTVISISGQDLSAAWPAFSDVAGAFATLLHTGTASLTPVGDSVHTAATAHYSAVYAAPASTVTVYALFEAEANADAAAALAGSGLIAALDALLGITAAEVDAPAVYVWHSQGAEDPTSIDPVGFRVESVAFDHACMSQGCWVVDVTYSPGTSASANVLYLPRAVNANPTTPDPYSAGVHATFLPSNFPCGAADYDPASPSQKTTACCLESFASSYRPVRGFETWITANMSQELAVCNASLPGAAPASSVLPATDFPAPDGVDDVFSDMPLSRVTNTRALDSGANTFRAQLRLDDWELRTQAAVLTGTTSAAHTLNFFVGMAHFTPTGGTAFLDSIATQTAVTVTKTDTFAMSSSGSNAYTFLDYMNVRVHEVLAPGAPAAQYAAVSFTLGAEFRANVNTGAVVLSSVRVGKGTSPAAATWQHACHTAAGDGAFDDAATQAAFGAALAQDCGPQVAMCTNQASITQQFATVNVPLGEDYFGSADFTTSGETSVFVEMTVSVFSDVTGLQSSTKLAASVPLTSAAINTWCDASAAATFLKQVADMDLVVGLAAREDEMARVRTVADLIENATGVNAAPTASLDSASVESGLLTLVLKGNASFFGLARAADFSLELEDVVTLHFLESSDLAFSAARLLVDTGAAFTVQVDAAGNRASMEPTAALLALCPFTASGASACVARRDVRARVFPSLRGAAGATAMEVSVPGGAADAAAEAAFMQQVLGESEHAAVLGTNFSALLHARYALNDRYNRAWWVQAGYAWPGARAPDRLALAQRLVVVALAGLDESFGGRRRRVARALLASSDARAPGLGAAAIERRNVDTGSVVAAMLGADPEVVSTWKVGLRLTEAQACKPAAVLREELRNTTFEYLRRTASSLTDVQIMALTVRLGDLDCGVAARRARALLASVAFSGAEVHYEAVLVFANKDDMVINVETFSRLPGVMSMEPVATGSGKVVIDNGYTPEGGTSLPYAPSAADEGLATELVAAAAILGALALACGGALGALLWRRRRERAVAEALVPSALAAALHKQEQYYLGKRSLSASSEASTAPLFRLFGRAAPSASSAASAEDGLARFADAVHGSLPPERLSDLRGELMRADGSRRAGALRGLADLSLECKMLGLAPPPLPSAPSGAESVASERRELPPCPGRTLSGPV